MTVFPRFIEIYYILLDGDFALLKKNNLKYLEHFKHSYLPEGLGVMGRFFKIYIVEAFGSPETFSRKGFWSPKALIGGEFRFFRFVLFRQK
jgi:hypothetical protein